MRKSADPGKAIPAGPREVEGELPGVCRGELEDHQAISRLPDLHGAAAEPGVPAREPLLPTAVYSETVVTETLRGMEITEV
jgi:hypothetical protein